ncbi:MAG: DUF3990 domain-containing protein [Prevotellaceae bacterium]|nr:DUF3990 domain-containing protein [Prevotellaceae bacterium]
MLIYHASDIIVDKPDTLHSRSNLDFGKGFYATVIKEQAERYAQKFILRNRKGILNVYEYTPTVGLNIKLFEAYDSEWLDFVAACRIGEDLSQQYDVICGGIANDRVFNTLDLYFSNQMTKEETLKRLIYEKPNQQFCFTNQVAIDRCIKFIESKEIKI